MVFGTDEKLENSKKSEFLVSLINGIEVKFESWKETVVFPSLFAIVLVLLVSIVVGEPPKPYNEPLWFAILTSGFLNPIYEEILFRGILLGAFFSAGLIWFKEDPIKKMDCCCLESFYVRLILL